MGYFQSILKDIEIKLPVILGHLAFQVPTTRAYQGPLGSSRSCFAVFTDPRTT